MGTHPSQPLKHRAVMVVDRPTYERMQNWNVADEDQINAAIATFCRLFDIDPTVFKIYPAHVIDVAGVSKFVDIE